MGIQAKNNTVVMRPNFEALRRLSQFALQDETIETKEFGAVKVGAPKYDNSKGGNRIAWGEVQSVGPGPAWMQGKYRLDRVLQRGDVIGYDLAQQCAAGDSHLIPVNAALCRFNPGMAIPEPLGPYILTVEEAGAAERLVFTDALTRRGLTLPRNDVSGTIKVSDSPTSKVKQTVERILAVGTGGWTLSEKFKEVVYVKPDTESIGRLALFMYVMSVDCYIGPLRHRFTNWDKVRGLVEED